MPNPKSAAVPRRIGRAVAKVERHPPAKPAAAGRSPHAPPPPGRIPAVTTSTVTKRVGTAAGTGTVTLARFNPATGAITYDGASVTVRNWAASADTASGKYVDIYWWSGALWLGQEDC